MNRENVKDICGLELNFEFADICNVRSIIFAPEGILANEYKKKQNAGSKGHCTQTLELFTNCIFHAAYAKLSWSSELN